MTLELGDNIGDDIGDDIRSWGQHQNSGTTLDLGDDVRDDMSSPTSSPRPNVIPKI